MTASFLRGLCPAALLWAVWMTHARAAWHEIVATEKDSGVAVEVSSPFDHSPPAGYLPLWVTIRNDSGATRTWSIFCNGSGMYGNSGRRQISTGSLRVENGQTVRVPVLMNLDDSPNGYYRLPFIRVEGYAIPTDSQTQVPAVNVNGKGNATHSVGMSETLATPIWTSLTKWYTDDSHDLMGTPVDPGLLGGDWRALLGLDDLWLTDADYAALDAPRRGAIHDWVSHGGRLYVCAQTADPALRAAVGLPATGDESDAGLGHVQLIPWDGKPLPLETLIGQINREPSERADAAFTGTDWPMVTGIGRIPLNTPLLIAFIAVFALVVGPLNLFWFANAARRHRLFWTTPLLSVGASLLLVGFIILQDGFGGSGQRVLFYRLLPDEKKAVVLQEQTARTGVLFARSFQTTEEVVLTPLQVGDGSESRSFEQNGRNYTGDWFASRSVQAQRVEAVVPSRAEIQLLNADAARDGAPPVLTSSVPAELKEIRYVDAAGRRWIGDGLRTGERITLRADVQGKAVAASANGGSKILDHDLAALLSRPGYFTAVASDGPFFDTLPSVRWKEQRAIFAGPVSITR